MRAFPLGCLVAGVALTAATGCGEATGTSTQADTLSDARLAAKIQASAEQRRQQRIRQERVAASEEAAREPIAAADALPAGSAEIDGARSTTATSSALLSAADRASFVRLGARLPGSEGVAVATLGRSGRTSRAGSLRTGVAWSTAKVPVAMAAVSAGKARQQDLVQAIAVSDNAAAERLWSALGSPATAAAAADAQLRAAGDLRTQIQSRRLRAGFTAFGQTAWALTDQARFAAGLPCSEAGTKILGLMGQVVAGQRWGLGSTGKTAQFKAGWGPGITPGRGDGWLDRQMGIVTIKGRPIAVAIATTAADHSAGTRNVTEIARWVVSHVDIASAPQRPAC